MVRRLNRYCFARMQIKMSWNWENMFNILRFHQKGFLQERFLTAYAMQWKAKTHARLYYAGDVTERTWRKTFQDRGGYKREKALYDAIKNGDMGKLLVGFNRKKSVKQPVEIGRRSTHGMWGGAKNGFKMLEQMDVRLDTSLFRCMFVPNIFDARKLISSGVVYVNDKVCTVSDHRLDPGDCIQVRDFSQVHKNIEDENSRLFMRLWAHIPSYWEVNFATCSAILLHIPEYNMIPTPYHERVQRHFLEFYHRLW